MDKTIDKTDPERRRLLHEGFKAELGSM